MSKVDYRNKLLPFFQFIKYIFITFLFPVDPMFSYTLKNAGLFQPKFGSNMDKPKCWVKNAI